MKPRFLAASAVFCLTVLLLLQVSVARNELNNKNETCRDGLFTLDGNSRRGRTFGSKKSLNCFGLGSALANTLDFFLRSRANGTSLRTLKVKFYAYSRNRTERIALSHGEAFNLTDVDFDITRRTTLIVHGFLSNGDEKWIEDMKRALLKWDDVNVFVVDWSTGSNTWNYFKAAVNTRTVGDQIATFFGQLVEASTQSNEVKPSSFGSLHFIGHSLGSHICGYAATEMRKRQNKWSVQRITGLDPAQPCFIHSDPSLRLDRDDAPFVDVIHTNGRVLSQLGLGMPQPIGHVDFYPNGGQVQPGCGLSANSAWNYLPLPAQIIAKTVCSHGRSHLYFIDSIVSAIRRSCTFWAHEWDLTYERVEALIELDCKNRRCVEMGINAEKYAFNGTFLTITGKSQPYCHIDRDARAEVKEIMRQSMKKLCCQTKAEPRTEAKDEVLVKSTVDETSTS